MKQLATSIKVQEMQDESRNCIALDNLRFCKAVLMLLIAFYHSIAFWRGWQNTTLGIPAFESPFLARIADFLSQIHVYAFVAISGYLFCYLQIEKGRYGDYLGLLKNKAKRLLIPLLFVSVVWLIPFAVLKLNYDGSTVLHEFLLMEEPLQLWFLLMLFWVFVMAWPLSKIFSGGGYKYTGLCFLIVGVLWAASFIASERLHIPDYFRFVTAPQYLVPFFIGYAMRYYGDRRFYRIPTFVWITADVMVYCVSEVVPAQGMLLKLVKYGCGTIHPVLGGVMLFVVLVKLADRVNWRKSKLFSFFAERSMTIYLFHEQFIYITLTLFNSVLPPIMHGLVNFVISIAGASCISVVFYRFPKLRVLIGEK